MIKIKHPMFKDETKSICFDLVIMFGFALVRDGKSDKIFKKCSKTNQIGTFNTLPIYYFENKLIFLQDTPKNYYDRLWVKPLRKRDLDAFLLEIQKFINDCANLFPGRDLKETIDYNLDLSKFTPVEMQERRTQQNLRKKGK